MESFFFGNTYRRNFAIPFYRRSGFLDQFMIMSKEKRSCKAEEEKCKKAGKERNN